MKYLLLVFSLSFSTAIFSATESESIRQYFESLDAGAEPAIADSKLEFPDILSQIYQQRMHAPIWLEGGPLAEQGGKLIAAIERSIDHGMNPDIYHLNEIRNAWAGSDVPLWAIDLLLSDAFLKQVLHRSSGVVSPHDINSEWYVTAPEIDLEAFFTDVINRGPDLVQVLRDLLPQSAEYWALVAERIRIDEEPQTLSVLVPEGEVLRRGSRGERVQLLQTRLLGPDDHDGIFGPALESAVMAFQSASGLEPDGIVGNNTIALLNANRFDWLDRIDANLERWRWLPRENPQTYIRVNIAAFDLQAYQSGEPVLNMQVIVGRPYRQSPIFTESIKYLVVNPYWNVPTRIAVQDKLPLLKSDAAALVADGFEAKQGDALDYQPVDQFQWERVTRSNFNYQLRQKPGPANALGRLKFMLPNPYSVYLHDTPARELFSRTERLFSSGCIRLEHPDMLARWLLENDRSANLAELDTLLQDNATRTIYLRRPVPVYIVYFTAFTDQSGEVVFRRDIYARDMAIVNALRAS